MSYLFNSRIYDLVTDEGLEGDLDGAVLGACKVADKPRHVLHQEQLVHIYDPQSTANLDLNLRIPDSDSWFHRYFSERFAFGSILHEIRGEDPLKRYHQSLNANGQLRLGKVDFICPDKLEVTPGIRRAGPLSEDKIGQGIFYHQIESDRWCAVYAIPEFYAECVAPHLKSSTANTPIDWCVERMAIVNGYAARIGHEFPPYYAEHAYTFMAKIVCNSFPEILRATRHYDLDDSSRKLLNYAAEKLGEDLLPEHTIFLLENSGILTPKDLDDQSVFRFLKGLHQALDNGLVIDRVSELAKFWVEKGSRPDQAIFHAARITRSIYGGNDSPWWFKEDFDLRPLLSDFTDINQAMRLEEDLARVSGFAYQFVREIFHAYEDKLSSMGLSREAALKFSSEVTKLYGIGNPKRAENIIDFALESLGEVSLNSRSSLLKMFEETLYRARPLTETLGALEGSEINFSKPGVFNLYATLKGVDALLAGNIDASNIGPKEIREVVADFSRPLLERAKIPPPIAPFLSLPPFLTDQLQAAALPMPLAEEMKLLSVIEDKPIFSWLTFEKRLHSEVNYRHEHISRLYFSFYAAKLPNPFNPPAGFLSLIEKMEQIPNPAVDSIFFHAPSKREDVEKKNAQAKVDRYSLVAHLLDAWVMGILNWEEIEKVCKWVTADISVEQQKAIEEKMTWEYGESSWRNVGERFKWISEQDIRLQKKISYLQRELWLLQEDSTQRSNRIRQDITALEYEQRHLHRGFQEEFGAPNSRERREWLERSIEDTKREKVGKFQLERLRQLESGLTALAEFNQLVITGALERPIAADCLSSFLGAIVSDSADDITGLLPSESFPNSLFSLKELQDSGLLSTSRLVERLRACQKNSDFIELAKEVGKLRKTYGLAVAEAERAHSLVSGFGKGPEEKARAKYFEIDLTRSVSTLIAESKLVDQETTKRFIEERFWPLRYRGISEDFKEFREKFLAKRPVEKISFVPGAQTIYERGTLLLSSWFIINALQLHRENVMSLALEGLANFPDTLEDPSDLRLVETLGGKLAEASELLRNIRSDKRYLLPVGGKIHVLHQVDAKRFEYLRDQLGLRSTDFRLIHADHSVILPAMASSSELKIVIKLLDNEHVIDWDHPELQISIPGRLPAASCAILGSATLLATEEGVQYSAKSFETNQNETTGYRIMAYDAGGNRDAFPFDTKLSGRTDILGRRHLSDIDLYQTLGTVLIQELDGGPFGKLGTVFCEKYREILVRHQLETVLEASWIMEDGKSRNEDAGTEHFLNAIKPCTDAWFECQKEFERSSQVTGVVREVRELFNWLEKEVSILQSKLDDTYQGDPRAKALFIV